MMSISESWKNFRRNVTFAFGRYYHKDEQIHTGIRAAIAFIPLIISIFIPVDFYFELFDGITKKMGPEIKSASLATSFVFWVAVGLNTFFDQISDKKRDTNKKARITHRFTHSFGFALIVIIIKYVWGRVTFPMTGFPDAAAFLVEGIEIILFVLILCKLPMKKG